MKTLKVKATASILALVVAIMTMIPGFKAYAGQVSITFDQESYDEYENADFDIEVNINASGNIGYYHVELVYDAGRMDYVSGADKEGDEGKLILEGTGYGDSITYSLKFHSAHSGPAGIAVDSAELYGQETDGYESYMLDAHTMATVVVRGDDVLHYDYISDYQVILEEREAAEAKEMEALQEAEEAVQEDSIEYNALGKIVTAEGKELYLVDHRRMMPEDISWNYELISGVYEGQQVTYLSDTAGRLQILYLMDEDGYGYPYAIRDDKAYPVYKHLTLDGKEYIYAPAEAADSLPVGIDAEAVQSRAIVCAIDDSGLSEYFSLGADNELYPLGGSDNATADNEAEGISKAEVLIIFGGIFALLTLVIMIISSGRKPKKISKEKRAKKRQKARKARARKKEKAKRKAQKYKEAEKKRRQKDADYDEDVDYVDLEANLYNDDEYYEEEEYYEYAENIEETDGELATEEYTGKEVELEAGEEYASEEVEEPIISVQNVTMKFKLSTSNASGLKEYLIQMLKKQVTFRELVALDNVSFDAYKGEVVGIIGTNGSGKSTILKIVSGALSPTSGKVVVDKSKVQLLTLGTGFDMELTARENVYLNGALIGYSKHFIDKHYDEIVEFAELEGFMEERVKNFSSGMVSRLGFAIATAGRVSEILILDEVLSVGDEFFRKKSLARVKEMIHGGSTVLMVSHSMSTIIDNCSKVVWIEKGKLQMVGEAKEVCKLYSEQKVE